MSARATFCALACGLTAIEASPYVPPHERIVARLLRLALADTSQLRARIRLVRVIESFFMSGNVRHVASGRDFRDVTNAAALRQKLKRAERKQRGTDRVGDYYVGRHRVPLDNRTKAKAIARLLGETTITRIAPDGSSEVLRVGPARKAAA